MRITNKLSKNTLFFLIFIPALLLLFYGGEKLLWNSQEYPDIFIKNAYVAKDTAVLVASDKPMSQYCEAHKSPGCAEYQDFTPLEIGGNDLQSLCDVQKLGAVQGVWQTGSELLVRCSPWNVFRVIPLKPGDKARDNLKPMVDLVQRWRAYNRFGEELFHDSPVDIFFVGLDNGKKHLSLSYCYQGSETPAIPGTKPFEACITEVEKTNILPDVAF